MAISNPFFDDRSFDDFYSKRLSDFGSSDFNTKTASSFVDPFVSMASQKPDLTEFLSTARSSGPRLQSLAGQLPDLSNLRAETTGNIEDMPSFKAATKAYEAGVEPGVINQMTLRGLGSGSALAGALGRTRAGAMLPIIQDEQARRDRAIQSIAGYEDTANARKLGAQETSDTALLRSLLSAAGYDENAISRALGAAEVGTGRVLDTGLAETGRTFTAGENEKNRQIQLKLGELQRQGMLGFAGGQFGAAALPTILGLLGLGKKADGTQPSLLDILGLGSKPKQTPPGGGATGGTAATAAISKAIQALIAQGVSPSTAELIVQSIDPALISSGVDLSQIGQFGQTIFPSLEGGPFDPSLVSNFSDASTGAVGTGGEIAADLGGKTFGPGDAGFLDSIGGLGGLSSFLGLGTGIAGLARGGDTASKALSGMGTATSAAGLASSLGLLPSMAALGPIGMGIGLIKFLSSLAGGGNAGGAKSDAQSLKGENMWIANIQSNPTKWIADMEHDMPGVGGNLAAKALGGQIKGEDDLLKELGMTDIMGALQDYNIHVGGWAGDLPGSTLTHGSPMWAATRIESSKGIDIPWLLQYADTIRRAKAEGLPWGKEVANATNQDPKRFIETLSQMDTETFKRQMYGTPDENDPSRLRKEFGGGEDRGTAYFDPKTLQWLPPGGTDNSSD